MKPNLSGSSKQASAPHQLNISGVERAGSEFESD